MNIDNGGLFDSLSTNLSSYPEKGEKKKKKKKKKIEEREREGRSEKDGNNHTMIFLQTVWCINFIGVLKASNFSIRLRIFEAVW